MITAEWTDGLRHLFILSIIAGAMKPQNVVFVLALVLVVFVILISRFRHEPRAREIFNRSIEVLHYTAFARCKMTCNAISEEDVRYVVAHGIINLNRSDRNHVPCPSFALQGTLAAGRDIRAFFTQCGDSTTVVDCVQLGLVRKCDCEGTN